MPQIMSLEGPNASAMYMTRSGPQVRPLEGFWQNITDTVADAASGVAHIFSAQSQPKRTITRKPLHGIFDPITSRPWVAIGGILLGAWLAGSERGKKLTKSYGFGGARRRRR